MFLSLIFFSLLLFSYLSFLFLLIFLFSYSLSLLFSSLSFFSLLSSLSLFLCPPRKRAQPKFHMHPFLRVFLHWKCLSHFVSVVSVFRIWGGIPEIVGGGRGKRMENGPEIAKFPHNSREVGIHYYRNRNNFRDKSIYQIKYKSNLNQSGRNTNRTRTAPETDIKKTQTRTRHEPKKKLTRTQHEPWEQPNTKRTRTQSRNRRKPGHYGGAI